MTIYNLLNLIKSYNYLKIAIRVKRSLYQLLICFNQLINNIVSLFVGGGWADETISARAYRSKHNKYWFKAYKAINFIFFWQTDHCEESYESEKNMKHLPPRYRNTL